MAAGQRTLAVCALAVISLVAAGAASATSPQRIYGDLADNGRLDGRYTRADIERALTLEQVVRSDADRVRRPAAVTPSRPRSSRPTDGLPFTGVDLALLTVGGGPLLLIGLALRRRLARPVESTRVEVVRG